MDLDMLSSDFFIVTTTSARGSRYEDTLSQTKCMFLAPDQVGSRLTSRSTIRISSFPSLRSPHRHIPPPLSQRLHTDRLRPLQTLQSLHQYSRSFRQCLRSRTVHIPQPDLLAHSPNPAGRTRHHLPAHHLSNAHQLPRRRLQYWWHNGLHGS